MSNTKNRILALFTVLGLTTSCNITMHPNNQVMEFVNRATQATGQATNLPVHMPDSVVVCRAKQCAPVHLSMSAEYIYNSLVALLQNNMHQTALICTGSDTTHSCIETYVAMPITVGITPAYAYIDAVKISDVTLQKGKKTLNLVLNYNLTFNGQTPDCTPSRTLAFVRDTKTILFEDSGYNCKMTTISTTEVKTLFAVDYIDLDYGFIGGYYSIGLSGPAYGGGNGYMLIRLPKDAHPLAPALQTPKEKHVEEVLESTITGNLQSNDDQIFSNVQVFPIQK